MTTRKGAGKPGKHRRNAGVGNHPMRSDLHRDHLLVLATATTAYHEAPPDRAEEARIAYEEALKVFQEHNALAECTR